MKTQLFKSVGSISFLNKFIMFNQGCLFDQKYSKNSNIKKYLL